LAIFAFSLSLLGTFLVRSGVITSVHSFAADPGRGLFILLLLAIAVGSSLTLYAFRASTVQTFSRFALYSRETALLVCNIILVVATVTVMLGTLYPLLVDAMGLGKISVGPPYFNAVFVPIMSLLFVVMGIGPLIRWKKAKQGELRKQMVSPLVISIVFGVAFPFLYGGEFAALVTMGVGLACWVFLVVMQELLNQVNSGTDKWNFSKLTLSQWGMTVAHMGIAITITGVTLVSMYESETNVKMYINDKVKIDDTNYEISFNGIKKVKGANYSADQGQIEVYNDGEFVTLLKPERRTYLVQTMGMTEAGIDPGLFRDIYVALGDPLPGNAWAIRVHYKPFVRWIWLGAIFMGIGGFLAILDKRYRRKKVMNKAEKASLVAPAVDTLATINEGNA